MKTLDSSSLNASKKPRTAVYLSIILIALLFLVKISLSVHAAVPPLDIPMP